MTLICNLMILCFYTGLVENSKSEVVLSRGLFDKFSKPEIDAETNVQKQADNADCFEVNC